MRVCVSLHVSVSVRMFVRPHMSVCVCSCEVNHSRLRRVCVSGHVQWGREPLGGRVCGAD